LITLLFLSACNGSHPNPDDTSPALFEGDNPGECSDGADNDRDGLFDCDDDGCAGSPDCSAGTTDTDTGDTSTGTVTQPGTDTDTDTTGTGTDTDLTTGGTTDTDTAGTTVSTDTTASTDTGATGTTGYTITGHVAYGVVEWFNSVGPDIPGDSGDAWVTFSHNNMGDDPREKTYGSGALDTCSWAPLPASSGWVEMQDVSLDGGSIPLPWSYPLARYQSANLTTKPPSTVSLDPFTEPYGYSDHPFMTGVADFADLPVEPVVSGPDINVFHPNGAYAQLHYLDAITWDATSPGDFVVIQLGSASGHWLNCLAVDDGSFSIPSGTWTFTGTKAWTAGTGEIALGRAQLSTTPGDGMIGVSWQQAMITYVAYP